MLKKISVIVSFIMLFSIISPVFRLSASESTLVQSGYHYLAAAGFSHTAAVKKDGTVWCWGENDDGQLGNGTKKTSSSPLFRD